MTSQKQNDPRIVIISGYSGCGKGTVISRLMEKYGNYAFSVSMTTRDPRDNEIDGVHYHFVTNERFEKMISEAGFLEYAGYTDNYYGTPAAFVHENLAAGRDVLLDIEVQGAMQIKEKFPEAVTIFITTPSAQEMENRLEGRKTETAEQISGRFDRAVDEAECMDKYDYVVVNDQLDECVRQLERIISQKPDEHRFNPAFKKRFVKELHEIIAKRAAKKAEKE
jgi:guanylate kinase